MEEERDRKTKSQKHGGAHAACRMQGLITTKHLLTEAPTIVGEFGLRTYLRCVRIAFLSRRDSTFLECVLRL